MGHSWDSSALLVGCPQSQRGWYLVPVLTLPLEEQGPRAFKSHWLFIGDLNESEEEEEGEEDNDGDEGENEEEEEDDVEAGSEKEEEARLTALEEQRMEEKVLESDYRAAWEAAPLVILVPALAHPWYGWVWGSASTSVHPVFPETQGDGRHCEAGGQAAAGPGGGE